MKKRPSPIEGNPSAAEKRQSIGTLPKSQNTVAAEVLARALKGESLTGLDMVFGANTTRLAAHIDYLEKAYGWEFKRSERAHGCADGRLSYVMAYWLDASAIQEARCAGAADWCKAVEVARRCLKAEAPKVREVAARVNACRRPLPGLPGSPRPSGQLDLFGGAQP